MKDRFRDKVLLDTDDALCGPSQVTARDFFRLSGRKEAAEELARNRRRIATAVAWEVAGRSLALSGLENSNRIHLAVGTGIALISRAFQMGLKNTTGGEWSVSLQGVVDTLGPYQKSVNAALLANGVSAEEANSLGELSGAVYRADLSAPRLKQTEEIVKPVSLLTTMAYYEDFYTAAILAGITATSIPLKNFIHKHDLKQAAARRVARSAGNETFLRKVLKKHRRNTNISNGVASVPEAVAVAALVLTEASNSVVLYGLLRGMDFSDFMGEQRKREEALRTRDISETMIKALSNKPFIATPQRWKEHVSEAGIDVFAEEELPFANGIIIKDFVAHSPSGERTSLNAFNMEVGAGDVMVIQAPSGTGKSITLASIMQRFEHEGAVHLVENGQRRDVHSLVDPEEVAQKILLISKDNFHGSERLADLLKPCFKYAHMDLYEAQCQAHDPLLIDVAWSTADNMLEDQIKKFSPESKEDSIFPVSMKESLIEVWEKRKKWINDHLSQQPGNLAKLTAGRVFGTLSAGETNRFLAEMAYMATKYTPPADQEAPVAVILDEPLAGLDPDINLPAQINTLRRIQSNGAALLLVAHESVDKLQEGLNNCELVKLDKKQIRLTGRDFL